MKDRWSDTIHRFIVMKNIPPTVRDVQEFSTRKLVELSCNIKYNVAGLICQQLIQTNAFGTMRP